MLSDLRIEPDHLVVACRTLDAGRAWCEATFGVSPETGGRHVFMGTHNLLLAVSSARFPKTYLELIAVDPDAPNPDRPRWFDLDQPPLRAAVADAPLLVHWVARTSDIVTASDIARRAGHDPGPVLDAERMTSRGLLRWRITLADDGARASDGALPLLIEWSGDVHPADALPPSGVELQSLNLGGVAPGLAMLLGADAQAVDAVAPLVAVLKGPKGPVTLASPRPAAR